MVWSKYKKLKKDRDYGELIKALSYDEYGGGKSQAACDALRELANPSINEQLIKLMPNAETPARSLMLQSMIFKGNSRVIPIIMDLSKDFSCSYDETSGYCYGCSDFSQAIEWLQEIGGEQAINESYNLISFDCYTPELTGWADQRMLPKYLSRLNAAWWKNVFEITNELERLGWKPTYDDAASFAYCLYKEPENLYKIDSLKTITLWILEVIQSANRALFYADDYEYSFEQPRNAGGVWRALNGLEKPKVRVDKIDTGVLGKAISVIFNSSDCPEDVRKIINNNDGLFVDVSLSSYPHPIGYDDITYYVGVNSIKSFVENRRGV